MNIDKWIRGSVPSPNDQLAERAKQIAIVNGGSRR